MAISTYSALQAAVLSWLDRDDLAASVPDWVSLAHARLNRELRVADMETIADAPTPDGTGFVPLPDGYLEMRTLTVMTDRPYALRYVPPGDLALFQTGNATPVVFSQVNRFISVAPVPPTGTVLRMGYYTAIPALSDTVPANWLLLKAPSTYLYATLHEAALFLRDAAAAQAWDAKYRAEVDALVVADQKSRRSAGPLSARSSVYTPRTGRGR